LIEAGEGGGLNHRLFAEVALTFISVVQPVATIAIDFNRTHDTNPRWPGHARFHVVWQGSTVVLLSILGILLIWHRGPHEAQRFYVAALLAALSPLGFLTACTSRELFGATLSDSNGIHPLRVRFLGSVRRIDLNLAAVIAALLSLLLALLIFRS
jgi:hypothetical protein